MPGKVKAGGVAADTRPDVFLPSSDEFGHPVRICQELSADGHRVDAGMVDERAFECPPDELGEDLLHGFISVEQREHAREGRLGGDVAGVLEAAEAPEDGPCRKLPDERAGRPEVPFRLRHVGLEVRPAAHGWLPVAAPRELRRREVPVDGRADGDEIAVRLVQIANFSLKRGEKRSLKGLSKGPEGLKGLVERMALIFHVNITVTPVRYWLKAKAIRTKSQEVYQQKPI